MINSLIEVYRMQEIKPATRANIIIKLGMAINDHYAMNITEPIVYELVLSIFPDHPIKDDNHYLKICKKDNYHDKT